MEEKQEPDHNQAFLGQRDKGRGQRGGGRFRGRGGFTQNRPHNQNQPQNFPTSHLHHIESPTSTTIGIGDNKDNSTKKIPRMLVKFVAGLIIQPLNVITGMIMPVKRTTSLFGHEHKQ